MKLSSLVFDIAGSNNLLDLLELAIKCDQCGFSRLWLGEHYGNMGFWNNPEPLIPVLLGITKRINVGCAGILVKYHSPLRIASSFKLINSIYPERVDLGFAAGKVHKEVRTYLYKFPDSELEVNDFFNAINKILSFYKDEEVHNKKHVYIHPQHFPSPNLWLLTTDFNRLNDALDLGVNFSKSIFHINSSQASENQSIEKFKNSFIDKYYLKPEINLAFSGILTKDDKETTEIRRKIDKGMFSGFQCNIVATETEFCDKINSYQEKFGINDFSFLDLSPRIEKRIENIEILSENLNIKNH
ncbi:LLM class flavin-dependent oxidoreductase [Maribacter flavus]|uniref:LLM class flavin-dependent oxidoreductase n=1 Tax=Maribacter flavus TaxID=1658664 RepID=A0A5B2TVK7_9FLAO|nr:LLM class flavin-dependent oxidoreductase [Maribacter flavus]KAA2218527.1 LLM class flavin-dependent oxidoreductase [Maribacter flavus]